MSLISIDDLKNYITYDSTKDDVYQSIINSAEAVVKNYIGYSPEETSYNEMYANSVWNNTLMVKNYPITNIYDIKVNGVQPDLSTLNIDTKHGSITFTNHPVILLESTGDSIEISIDYDAGYADIPLDIKDSVCKLVAWELARINRGDYGVKTQAVGDGTTTYELDMPLNIKRQLEKYVRSSVFGNKPITKITSFGVRA